jgi:hypothetical protein
MKPRCDELPGGGRNRLGVHSSAQPEGSSPTTPQIVHVGEKNRKKGITPNVHFVEMLQTHNFQHLTALFSDSGEKFGLGLAPAPRRGHLARAALPDAYSGL